MYVSSYQRTIIIIVIIFAINNNKTNNYLPVNGINRVLDKKKIKLIKHKK